MLVYRVRHKREDKGPYSYEWAGREYLGMAHDNCDAHPSPLHHRYSWVYGFASLEALISWFYEWIDELKLYGFTVAVYDVSTCDVYQEKLQLSFNPVWARQVRTIPL